jgi:flagellar basal body rod protein FlgC
MKKIKIYLLSICMLFTLPIQAISTASLLDSNAKLIMPNVEGLLGVKLTVSKQSEFYNSVFKPFTSNGWNLKPVSFNSAITGSKTNDSPVKFVTYTISNANRTIILQLIHYSEEKQIYIVTSEAVPVDTDFALSKYKEISENKEEYEMIYDQENYSMIQKKGYVNFTNFQIVEGNAYMLFSSSDIFNY